MNPKHHPVSRSKGTALLVAARIVSVFLNLASVPIFLRILGEDGYGAILFVLSLHGLLGLFEVGSTEILQRELSIAHAENDEEKERLLRNDQLSLASLSALIHLLTGVLFGFLFSLEKGGVSSAQSVSIFVLLGLQASLVRWNACHLVLLSARGAFDRVSIATVSVNLSMVALSLTGVVIFRAPWVYFAGLMAAEIVQGFVLRRMIRPFTGGHRARATFDWPRLKTLLRQIASEFPNRIATYLSAWVDKLLLGSIASFQSLAVYRNSARLPDSLRDVLNPLSTTSLPLFSQSFQASSEDFRRNVLQTATLVFGVASLLILAPSGFGVALLDLWLGKFAPDDGLWIMVLTAFYQAVQLYLAVVGMALFAASRRLWFVPITVVNALISVALTIPAFQLGGLIGVASMNVSIAVVQLAITYRIFMRMEMPGSEVARHFGQLLAITVATGAIVGVGVVTVDFCTQYVRPAAVTALIPVVCLAGLAIECRLKLIVLPERIARRLPNSLLKLLGWRGDTHPTASESRD